jgi:uncharacterized protein YbaR (Trm112 family)
MDTKFISVLKCPEPDCNGDLEIHEKEEVYRGEVMKGKLNCQSCDREYRIKDGFPILLAKELDDESELNRA